MAAAGDVWRCDTGPSTGLPHKWIYLGKARQMYRCESCLETITKVRLKAGTDNA